MAFNVTLISGEVITFADDDRLEVGPGGVLTVYTSQGGHRYFSPTGWVSAEETSATEASDAVH